MVGLQATLLDHAKQLFTLASTLEKNKLANF
jgi:hypothetical protein